MPTILMDSHSARSIRRLPHWRPAVIALIALTAVTVDARPVSAQSSARLLAPLLYSVSMPAPESHYAEVEVAVPAGPGPSFEMMMPVWSPGYYRIEDYAAHVSDVRARTADGRVLEVERSQKNRWRIHGSGIVAVSYRVFCNQRSVTTNYVGADYAVLNGAPTFMTLVGPPGKRPHEVRLSLPAAWQAMSGLATPPGGRGDALWADSYETLVDSPILAGPLHVGEFEVADRIHHVVAAGDMTGWDAAAASADLKTFVEETYRFWGFLPFDKYVFLLAFRQGGGGLEHMNSTLSTVSARMREGGAQERGRWGSLGLLAHEYFHLFNAKRLRPVELGPFDFEKPPATGSLWIAEGLTSYYSGLLLTRAGLRTPDQHLASLSNLIAGLQNAPGRLLQSVEQSSLSVWENSNSGINPTATTVSYYAKGNVLGLLLDARIRRITSGRRSLDDVMKLAYRRYAGARGYTADEFRGVAEEIAGVDLRGWFKSSVASAGELDYSELLEWYGLRFTASEGRAGSWLIERRPDATTAQKRNLEAWLRSGRP